MAIKFGKAAVAAKPAVAGKVAKPDNSGSGASLLPEDWVSGGLLNDVDVDITDCTFVDDWTYNGKIETPVLALRVTLLDENGTETIQHLSAGDLTRFIPSPDGKRAVKAEGSTATALNNNTNCADFIASIIYCGFPKKLLSDRVDVFEGMNVHIGRVPQKKRSGLADDGKSRDVMVVVKINRLPGEKATKVAGKVGAAVAKTVPATAGSDTGEELDEEMATAVAEIVVAVLTDKNGSVAIKTLPLAALKHLAGNENKAAIQAVLKDVDMLAAIGEATEAFASDGTTLTAA